MQNEGRGELRWTAWCIVEGTTEGRLQGVYYHRGLRRRPVSVPDMGAGRGLAGRDMRGARRVRARMVGVDNDPGEGRWHGGREGEMRFEWIDETNRMIDETNR